MKSEGQHVLRLNRMARLGDFQFIDPQFSSRDELAGQGSGFHDPREPQPFIDPLAFGLRRAAHPLPFFSSSAFSAPSAAKGESLSIGFSAAFFAGRVLLLAARPGLPRGFPPAF